MGNALKRQGEHRVLPHPACLFSFAVAMVVVVQVQCGGNLNHTRPERWTGQAEGRTLTLTLSPPIPFARWCDVDADPIAADGIPPDWKNDGRSRRCLRLGLLPSPLAHTTS